MAQACNNIGKDLSGAVLLSSSKRTVLSSPNPSKVRKPTSPGQGKRGVKRAGSPPPPPPPSAPPVTKRMAIHPSPALYFPPSPLIFDSLFLQQLSKSFYATSTSTASGFAHSSNSPFSPSSSRSAYLVDSLLAPPSGSFVCNWMSSAGEVGFCGQRFSNHYSLLEHLCSSHTSASSSSSKCSSSSSSQPSFFSSSVSKL